MEKNELDLKEIFGVLKRRWLVILAAALVCGAAAWCVSSFFVTPLYSAKVSMYVSSDTKRENAASVTASELSASARLVDTYLVILKSNSVLNEVIERLQLPYSTERLRNEIQASSINSTEAFSVTVTDPDPARAVEIANTVAQVAPDEIIRVVKVGSVEVIDWAELPQKPASPNIKRNTALGAVLGLLLSSVCLVAADLLDTAICREEDVTKGLGVPLLGVVPKLSGTSGLFREGGAEK